MERSLLADFDGWDTKFAGSNLSGAEFFIFEAKGNDELFVQAILADDSLGDAVLLTVKPVGPGYNWGICISS